MRHNIAFHVAFQSLGYHDFRPQQREEVVCRRERCIYHTGGGGGEGGGGGSLFFTILVYVSIRRTVTPKQ